VHPRTPVFSSPTQLELLFLRLFKAPLLALRFQMQSSV
jgi:hypothetical protein